MRGVLSAFRVGTRRRTGSKDARGLPQKKNFPAASGPWTFSRRQDRRLAVRDAIPEEIARADLRRRRAPSDRTRNSKCFKFFLSPEFISFLLTDHEAFCLWRAGAPLPQPRRNACTLAPTPAPQSAVALAYGCLSVSLGFIPKVEIEKKEFCSAAAAPVQGPDSDSTPWQMHTHAAHRHTDSGGRACTCAQSNAA